jgi:hypothetical protein
MPKWALTKFESSIELSHWELPGHMTEPQVEEVVRRLVCRHLSEDDIISSSLFSDDPKRYILLDRVEDPTIIQMGTNPYFIARLEE